MHIDFNFRLIKLIKIAFYISIFLSLLNGILLLILKDTFYLAPLIFTIFIFIVLLIILIYAKSYRIDIDENKISIKKFNSITNYLWNDIKEYKYEEPILLIYTTKKNITISLNPTQKEYLFKILELKKIKEKEETIC